MEYRTRIQSIIHLLPVSKCIADIGTDHGYLAIEAIKKQKAKKVIATDISKPSLQKAINNIRIQGYEDRISTYVANGLEHTMINNIDALIIAGMGGDLIVRILEDQPKRLDGVKAIILQPMTKIERVVEWVSNSLFFIADEDLVYDQKKYYIIFQIKRLEQKSKKYSNIDYLDFLHKKKHPLLYDYLEHKKKELLKKINIISNGSSEEAYKIKEKMSCQIKRIEELQKCALTFKQ